MSKPVAYVKQFGKNMLCYWVCAIVITAPTPQILEMKAQSFVFKVMSKPVAYVKQFGRNMLCYWVCAIVITAPIPQALEMKA